jgi:hypothetical protein
MLARFTKTHMAETTGCDAIGIFVTGNQNKSA